MNQCEDIGQLSIQEMTTLQTNLTAKFFDLKAIAADLDNKIDEMVSYPGHSSFKNNLRELQGAKGNGMKRFDKAHGVLKALAQQVPRRHHQDQAGRSFADSVPFRRGFAAAQGRGTGRGFLAGGGALKVILPKQLKARLDELAKAGAEGGGQ